VVAKVFEDPVLQQLVATAIRENYDLKAAAARVEQSRQLIGVARAEVLETLANVMLWRGILWHRLLRRSASESGRLCRGEVQTGYIGNTSNREHG
jgi:hypothetical protein